MLLLQLVTQMQKNSFYYPYDGIIRTGSSGSASSCQQSQPFGTPLYFGFGTLSVHYYNTDFINCQLL